MSGFPPPDSPEKTNEDPDPERVLIRMLGEFEVTRAGTPVSGFISAKARALLGYLASTKQPQSRKKLAGLFWGNVPEPDANRSLRVALANLRKIVAPILMVNRDSVTILRQGANLSDVESFEWQARIGLEDKNMAALETAAAIYQGDFLEGLFVTDAPAFEEWVLVERERLCQLMMRILKVLLHMQSERREYSKAIEYSQQLLALDAWQESAHRQLMISFARSGQRSAALNQYETCRRILQRELGVAPSRETQQLYERLKSVRTIHTHNLPRQQTPFVARVTELEALRSLLNDPTARLVTLVGPGGVGKTRLAIQIAHQVVGEYAGEFLHGVCFVDLSSVRDVEDLVSAIAGALQLSFFSGERPLNLLIRYLESKEIFLVMDNFEHFLFQFETSDGEGKTGSQVLMEILKATRNVKFLVTSRERLNLQAERVFIVQGFTYETATSHGKDSLSEAGLFFLESTRRTSPDFKITDQNVQIVERICELLAGLPLGIELASSWVRVMSSGELLQELERGIGILESTKDDIPPRHRSLTVVFDHSWDLLTRQEQLVLRRMAVFDGEYTREASEYVADADLHQLSALVDKSLVQKNMAASDGERSTYKIHELVRQYLLEKFDEDPKDAIGIRDRHSDYYAAYLEQLDRVLTGDQQMVGLTSINDALPNVRQAWAWAVQQGRVPALDRSLNSLFRYAWVFGRYQEVEVLFALATESLGGETDRLSVVTAGRLMARRAWLCVRLGQILEAQDYANESLALLQSQGADEQIAFPLRTLAMANRVLGNTEVMERALEESQQMAEMTGDSEEMAASLMLWVRIMITRGDTRTATEYLQRCRALLGDIGDRWLVGLYTHELGMLSMNIKDFSIARKCFEESRKIFEALGARRDLAASEHHLGVLAHRQGLLNDAKVYYESGLATFREVGDLRSVASGLNNLGEIAEFQGFFELADDHFRSSLDISLEIQDRPRQVITLGNLGFLSLREEKFEEAQQRFISALKLAWSVRNLQVVLEVLIGIASLALHTGRFELAIQITKLVASQPTLKPDTTNFRFKPFLKDLRARTGDDVYNELRTSEAALSFENIVEEVLSQMDNTDE